MRLSVQLACQVSPCILSFSFSFLGSSFKLSKLMLPGSCTYFTSSVLQLVVHVLTRKARLKFLSRPAIVDAFNVGVTTPTSERFSLRNT